MVEVEIRAPVFDEETGEFTWQTRAVVHARGGALDIDLHGTDPVISRDMVVLDVARGGPVTASDDPERWARNLPHSYRAGDLVAVVVCDDDPAASHGEERPADTAIKIPEPAAGRVHA